MKKIVLIIFLIAITTPAIAITDADAKIQKEQKKYQLKIEKIKKKQELKCIKHPEKCATNPAQETNLTLGVAQKNIKIGTSQDEVAMVLGSPNIVTDDSEGNDTWIYDKISSVASYNASGFNIGVGGMGGAIGSVGGGGGLANAAYGRSGSSVQTNQKTLTIVIKFKSQKVASFQYHMSNF